jgi:hypothetical protein
VSRRIAHSLIVFSALLVANRSFADERTDNMKVAFSLRFASFVSWADQKQPAQLRMCVAGSSEVVDRFRRLDGELAAGIPISVRSLNSSTPAHACEVAYFSGPLGRSEVALLQNMRQFPVLTVGDSESFLEDGGIIRIYESGNRMRFEISQAASRQAGLRISSKLLSLARGS